MLDFRNKVLIYTASGFHSLAGVRSVRLEASSLCQLKCPSCPTGTGANAKGIVGSGYLSLEKFRFFVDNHPKIRLIELSNYGEIFLNPELLEILKYGHYKKIHFTALNGVNLNDVAPDVLEGLVKYRVKGLTLSIDGASDRVYRMYRKNGDFNRVINNIERINYYKKKYRTHWPVLRWQFVIFDHNHHEREKAKEMARRMKALFFSKSCWDEDHQEGDLHLHHGVKEKKPHRQPFLLFCSQLWYQPQINWDGKLLGCCVNHFKDFGNVFDHGLDYVMGSDAYQRTKNILLGKEAPGNDSPCFFCPIYKKLGH